MSDYDTMIEIFSRAGIIYSTDWNREILLGSNTRVVRWILTTNKLDNAEFETCFKFNMNGGLESVSAQPIHWHINDCMIYYAK